MAICLHNLCSVFYCYLKKIFTPLLLKAFRIQNQRQYQIPRSKNNVASRTVPKTPWKTFQKSNTTLDTTIYEYVYDKVRDLVISIWERSARRDEAILQLSIDGHLCCNSKGRYSFSFATKDRITNFRFPLPYIYYVCIYIYIYIYICVCVYVYIYM